MVFHPNPCLSLCIFNQTTTLTSSKTMSSFSDNMSQKLVPGSDFPSITLPLVSGNKVILGDLQSQSMKLVIFYRGKFCPFCLGNLKDVNSKLDELNANGIDVLAVSADPSSWTDEIVKEHDLKFPVACELNEKQMRSLGLYISDPKDYQPQAHRFCEPAYFLLTPEGKIRYACVASFPMGGRVNVDDLLMGVKFVKSEVERRPEFQDVIWGSK